MLSSMTRTCRDVSDRDCGDGVEAGLGGEWEAHHEFGPLSGARSRLLRLLWECRFANAYWRARAWI